MKHVLLLLCLGFSLGALADENVVSVDADENTAVVFTGIVVAEDINGLLVRPTGATSDQEDVQIPVFQEIAHRSSGDRGIFSHCNAVGSGVVCSSKPITGLFSNCTNMGFGRSMCSYSRPVRQGVYFDKRDDRHLPPIPGFDPFDPLSDQSVEALKHYNPRKP